MRQDLSVTRYATREELLDYCRRSANSAGRLVLALLGGNFTGTAQSGTTYATVQRFTPNGWLLVGWNETLRGGGIADILWPLLIPLAFAVVFFAVAVLRFRKRFA